MSTREQRVARRSAEWSGEVVGAGQPKTPLYERLTVVERLRALVRLNERAWKAAGHAMPPPLPRAEWPGGVFEIRRRV